MKLMEVPTPIALLGGLLVMALSAHYMTARSKTGILGKAAAAVNLLCVVNASLGVNILMGLVYLFVRPFSASAVRKFNSNYAEAKWADAMSAILPPSKIIVTGEMPDDETQAVMIANHQIDSDFWFVWEVMRRIDRHGAVKIVLKDDLKYVPIIGWGMRAFSFIFLKRDWAKDRVNLERQLRVFTGDRFPLRLLIFPEGTTVNQRSMEKCTAFAKKEQRPTFEHLLLPRTTGFAACVNAFVNAASQPETAGERADATRVRGAMRGSGSGGRGGQAYSTRIVYDFTIAYTGYSGEIPTWEMGFTRNRDVDIPNRSALLRGRAPGPVMIRLVILDRIPTRIIFVCKAFHDKITKSVHIHIEKHHVEDVTSGDVKSWLDATWARKDALLSRFLADGQFPHEPVAVFESRKSPLAFLLLSTMPTAAGWLIYHGIVDLLALMAGGESGDSGSSGDATSL